MRKKRKKQKNSWQKILLGAGVFVFFFGLAYLLISAVQSPKMTLDNLKTAIVSDQVKLSTDNTVSVEKEVKPLNCEEAEIKLTAEGKEPLDPRKPIDVIMVLDRSGSMASGGKLSSLKAAVNNFIDQMNFSNENGSPDRIAIVKYNDKAGVAYGLGSDKSEAKNAVNGLTATGRTCIACGLDSGYDQIKDKLDPLREQVVVLMSDGLANVKDSGCNYDPKQCAVKAAEKIKDNLKLPVYSIGYGSDADKSTLRSISSGDDYYFDGDPSNILQVYNHIVREITNVSGYDARIVEVLPVGFSYVNDSASVEPSSVSSDRRTIIWEVGNIIVDQKKEVSFKAEVDYKKVDMTEDVLVDVYGETRVNYFNYDNTPYYVPFPETKAKMIMCPRPAIEIDKTADKEQIVSGETVVYTYVVKNIGNNVINQIEVNDDKLGKIDCPKTSLASDASMTCTKETKVDVQTTNIATVTGLAENGDEVTDDSTFTIYTEERSENLRVTKKADKETVSAGTSVTYSYSVENIGNVIIVDLALKDDKLGNVTCPKAQLQVGEKIDCSPISAVINENMTNTVTATGKSAITGEELKDSANATVKVKSEGIDVEKTVDSSVIKEGDEVTYTYVVENTGDDKLINVVVTDDKLGQISCPKTELESGEKMTCEKKAKIKDDTTNVVTVVGENPNGKKVSDKDEATVVTESGKGKGSIGNFIWNDVNCDGVQDANEVGIENVDMKLTWAGDDGKFGNSDDEVFRTDTNHNGHYTFEKLKSGKYRVRVKDEDVAGWEQTYDPDDKKDNKTNVTLAKNDDHTKADFGYCKRRVAPVTGVNAWLIILAGAFSTGLAIAFFKIRKGIVR